MMMMRLLTLSVDYVRALIHSLSSDSPSRGTNLHGKKLQKSKILHPSSQSVTISPRSHTCTCSSQSVSQSVYIGKMKAAAAIMGLVVLGAFSCLSIYPDPTLGEVTVTRPVRHAPQGPVHYGKLEKKFCFLFEIL